MSRAPEHASESRCDLNEVGRRDLYRRLGRTLRSLRSIEERRAKPADPEPTSVVEDEEEEDATVAPWQRRLWREVAAARAMKHPQEAIRRMDADDLAYRVWFAAHSSELPSLSALELVEAHLTEVGGVSREHPRFLAALERSIARLGTGSEIVIEPDRFADEASYGAYLARRERSEADSLARITASERRSIDWCESLLRLGSRGIRSGCERRSAHRAPAEARATERATARSPTRSCGSLPA